MLSTATENRSRLISYIYFIQFLCSQGVRYCWGMGTARVSIISVSSGSWLWETIEGYQCPPARSVSGTASFCRDIHSSSLQGAWHSLWAHRDHNLNPQPAHHLSAISTQLTSKTRHSRDRLREDDPTTFWIARRGRRWRKRKARQLGRDQTGVPGARTGDVRCSDLGVSVQ